MFIICPTFNVSTITKKALMVIDVLSLQKRMKILKMSATGLVLTRNTQHGKIVS